MNWSILLQTGDWVTGTSAGDEKFIGFVEAVRGGSVRVWVTQCDRESAIGTSIEAPLSKVKKMPDAAPADKAELLDLIELALATHDKDWFDSLSSELGSADSKQTLPAALPIHNRISDTRFRNSIDI